MPAVEGWFTLEEPAALLGSRCDTCGTCAFPKAAFFCGNPTCDGTTFTEVPLSRGGKVWSFTDARYQPPPPYMATEPYAPFAIAAVELAEEKMVVMGQVVAGVGVDDLRIGMDVELVIETLYEDDDHEYLVWKWRPCD
ncbi:MAG: OB-fold domain-containing protein [Actinobacteria bacterium]|nr:OB-fold domain-containing protein [Actinomycetota bacterium]